MKVMGNITVLGAGAALGFLAATGSVSAQENPCHGVAEHRLHEYGLTMSDLTDIEWIAQRSGLQHDGPVVSYHMWSLPKGCGSGNLAALIHEGLDIGSGLAVARRRSRFCPAYFSPRRGLGWGARWRGGADWQGA